MTHSNVSVPPLATLDCILLQNKVTSMINFNPNSLFAGGALSGTGSNGSLSGNTSALQGLSQILSGLAQALQALADLLGGEGGKDADNKPVVGVNPFAKGNGSTSPLSASPIAASSTSAPSAEKPIAGTARIWGDPHFIGADGDKFDVQGQAGKIYNLLSDQNFQLNGRFDSWGDKGATVVGKAAINADGNFITVDKSGEAFVNGLKLKDGQKVELFGGGYAEKKGNVVVVEKGEWNVNFQTHGDHINMDIKTNNAIADGVKPQGLIGQTFDGDGKALTGDAGTGAQGGGAIKDANGNLTKAGDKDAVKSYEVDSLFSSIFKNHNASGFAHLIADRETSADQKMADLRQQMQGLAMMGFFSLMASLQSNNNWGSSFR